MVNSTDLHESEDLNKMIKAQNSDLLFNRLTLDDCRNVDQVV